jgi:hypothetical protein
MRKYILPLLALYLDFILIDAVVGLVTYFLGEAIETLIGMPVSWAAQASASLLVLILLRLLNLSVGELLLAYAVAERQSGVRLRQWPNLFLGTAMLLSGLKEVVRWSAPGDGMPLLFLVEDTPVKVLVLMLFGALYILSGVMLLRFDPGAKIVNSALLALGAAIMAGNLLFFREAMVAAQLNRRLNQGLAADPQAAESVVAYAPLYGAVFFGALAAILYLCRERKPSPAFA